VKVVICIHNPFNNFHKYLSSNVVCVQCVEDLLLLVSMEVVELISV